LQVNELNIAYKQIAQLPFTGQSFIGY
jgi:hypothetical protein